MYIFITQLGTIDSPFSDLEHTWLNMTKSTLLSSFLFALVSSELEKIAEVMGDRLDSKKMEKI